MSKRGEGRSRAQGARMGGRNPSNFLPRNNTPRKEEEETGERSHHFPSEFRLSLS